MIHSSRFILFIKRYESILSSSVVIVVISILFFTLLVPNFTKAIQIYDNEKILKSRLSQLNAKNQSLEKLNNALYKDTLPKIYSVLPYHKDFVSLFNRFNQLQSKTGVTILRTDFQLGIVSTASASLLKQSVKGVLSIPMSVEVSGTRQQVQAFIDDLTDLTGRIITVQNVGWQLKDTGQMHATINGKAYFSLLPTTLGNIDTPLANSDPNREKIFTKIQQIELSDQTSEEAISVTVGKKDLFK